MVGLSFGHSSPSVASESSAAESDASALEALSTTSSTPSLGGPESILVPASLTTSRAVQLAPVRLRARKNVSLVMVRDEGRAGSQMVGDGVAILTRTPARKGGL